jgi:hypothetical protein
MRRTHYRKMDYVSDACHEMTEVYMDVQLAFKDVVM